MKQPKWSKRSYAAVLGLLPVLLLLTGCWDRKELNDLGIIVGTGLDKTVEENMVEVSVQLVSPKHAGGGPEGPQKSGEKPTLARSARGVTISDALSKMQEKLPRVLFWGHSKVLVIGEELAKGDNLKDCLDFMARHPKTRLNSYIFIKKGKASDLIATIPPWEKDSSEVVRELANSHVSIKMDIKDVLEGLSGDSRAAAIPWVEDAPWLGDSRTEHGFQLKGAAIIKNGRMVKYVDDSLVRGILWLRDEIQHPTITVSPKETKGYISMLQLSARTVLIPEIKNNRWSMTVKVETEDDVLENSSPLSLGTPKYLKLLEEAAEQDIRHRMEGALKVLQKEANADVIGFAEAFNRKYPKLWEASKGHWDDIFPGVQVTIDVKSKVRRPGLSGGPQGRPKEEIEK